MLLWVVSIPAVLKVGVILPMSGPLAPSGHMMWNGIMLAYSLKPNALNEKIEIVLIDDKSTKEGAADAVKRAIEQEKVIAIIGHLTSSNTFVGGSIAEERHVPMLSPMATNPWVSFGRKYISRICFTDPFQGEAAAVFAFNKLGARSAVVFTDIEQDYSVGLSRFFMKAFSKLGGRVDVVYYKTGDQDFSAQVSLVMAKNPDVIFITGYYPEAALIARQARQMGYKGVIMGGDGLGEPELIKKGGKAVEGVYFTTHFNPKRATTPMSKKFVQMYREKYGEDPISAAALGFDAYLILVDAMKRVLKSSPDFVNDLQGFRDALAVEIRHTKNFEGASGYITINSKGDAVKPVIIDVVKNGKFEFAALIYPEDIPR